VRTYEDKLTDLFKCVKGKTVMENASNNGDISKCIKSNEPSHLTCIEPSDLWVNDYADTQITSTVNEFYMSGANTQFDVIVEMGLLYKLHSPIHLIEQHINLGNPDTIILETMGNPGDNDPENHRLESHLNEIELMQSGDLIPDTHMLKQPIPYMSILYPSDIDIIMVKMGYKQVFYEWLIQDKTVDILNDPRWSAPKKHSWIGIYDKVL
tara:strand:+ start:1224 stop:1853 length:630 start_codon:yes stop_codon:yes gene_type:complete